MIKVQLTGASKRAFEKEFKAWQKLTKSNIDDSIRYTAQSVAFELMKKTRPFGSSASVGKKFQTNIAAQVVKGVARSSASTAVQAHKSSRKNGSVPGKLKFVKGTPMRPEADLENLIKRRQHNAGMIKAAWIVAMKSIKGKLDSFRLPNWIKRHINKTGIGKSSESGRGDRLTISITNNIDYVTDKLVSVNQSVTSGYRKAFGRIKKIVEKNSRI